MVSEFFRSARWLALTLATLAMIAACDAAKSPPERSADTQGWSRDQAAAWTQGTQGSRLIPYAWWKALEQADSDRPFADAAFLARFGLQPRETLADGLVLDRQDDSNLSRTKLRWLVDQNPQELWVGLNCAACHTGHISYRGQSTTILGGASQFDYQAFVEALDAAMLATRDSPPKWNRFVGRVLASQNSPENLGLLRAAVDQLIGGQRRASALNSAPLRFGPGRIDMFGHIFNAVQLALNDSKPTVASMNAPVSYPFLWDAYRQTQWQYDGIARPANIDLGAGGFFEVGAAGRDVGEMMGAFGEVVVPQGLNDRRWSTSLIANSLTSVNVLVRHLEPPKWPSQFGRLNQARIDAGRDLYRTRGCVGCHALVRPGSDAIEVRMTPLLPGNANNTDPARACFVATYLGRSGRLKGLPSRFAGGPPIRDMETGTVLLSSVVTGALSSQLGDAYAAALSTAIASSREPDPGVAKPAARASGTNICPRRESAPLAYKARPLNGIWATGPFLHNGAVPTLYDLLLPPARRPVSFSVGTREFDPVKVGYVSGAEAPGNRFLFDTRVAGNSNQGHDYRTGELTDSQRLALLEYLKTL